MKKYVVLLLAFGMLTGCSNAPAEDKPAEDKTTEKEEVATSGKYVVTNKTTETVTELYVYETGSKDKGENYAAKGLKDGDSVTIEVSVDEKDAEGYAQTLEYVTESGRTENGFKSLSLEEANINLLPADADAYTSATPFEWGF